LLSFGHSVLSPSFSLTHSVTIVISTLSLHDALPICWRSWAAGSAPARSNPEDARGTYRESRRARSDLPFHFVYRVTSGSRTTREDRKSTRLNSSHQIISYAVFCLKKKNKEVTDDNHR